MYSQSDANELHLKDFPKSYNDSQSRSYNIDLKDFSPKSFYDYTVDTLLRNETEAIQFKKRMLFDDSIKECDLECRIDLKCKLLSSDYDEWQQCYGR